MLKITEAYASLEKYFILLQLFISIGYVFYPSPSIVLGKIIIIMWMVLLLLHAVYQDFLKKG